MNEEKFTEEFFRNEAKNFIKASIARAFKKAEERGKITGINSIFNFAEELEMELTVFVSNVLKKLEGVIVRQNQLIKISEQLLTESKITKQMKETLKNSFN